jgi:hypothetical protein
MAIEYGNYSYGFIQNIIKNKMTDIIITETEKSLPAHSNVRGAASFK